MKGGMQAALGLGVGYVLRKRRKMRLATIMAPAAAGGLGGLAVKRATKVLGSTEALGTFAPQLGEFADTVRGDPARLQADTLPRPRSPRRPYMRLG
jgi:hypothetical protein